MDLHTVSETSKEKSPPTESIYLASTNVGKSGHRKLLRSSKKVNVKEQFKQFTDVENERKEATKNCQLTQKDIFENDKDDEDYDYVYR